MGVSISRSVIDRSLDRRRTLSQVRGVERFVGDATPRLLSSAEVLGQAVDRPCPVCGRHDLRETQWIHGDVLGEKSGTARSVREINGVIDALVNAHQDAEFSVHTVEVCMKCRWNHLIREELIGITIDNQETRLVE